MDIVECILLNTYPLNLVAALAAGRRDELFEAVFAVEVALLFNEANVLERALAFRVAAHKVMGAPNLAQGGDERSPGIKIPSFFNAVLQSK